MFSNNIGYCLKGSSEAFRISWTHGLCLCCGLQWKFGHVQTPDIENVCFPLKMPRYPLHIYLFSALHLRLTSSSVCMTHLLKCTPLDVRCVYTYTWARLGLFS